MYKINLRPLMLLVVFTLILCSCLTYVSLKALGAEDIFFKFMKSLVNMAMINK
ncbi:hypothetical protein ACQKOF_03250 [Lysinibacillus sp. NPDC093190]|uniref:hypothetical protein n=1 Tax=Lysinibacillus sp. NPDC093190 TaxID=3390575 RepID=UPI003D028596